MNNNRTTASVSDAVIVPVTEEYHIARARQAALALTKTLGFKQVTAFHVVTSVSELANNLFFHATRGGTISLVALERNSKIGIEVTAEDDGPGISNLKVVIEDGFSTNGGLGGGLPGVERLMDEFEMSSAVGIGTRIVARKWQ